jgi:predicted glycosyltransferase
MSEAIKQIAEHYGMKHQILKAMEELAELSAELSRLAVMNDVPLKMISFKEYEDQLAKVSEEIADVEIMLEQIKYFYDSEMVVEDIKVKKIARQFERMKGETK